jgi:hypothetical protein
MMTIRAQTTIKCQDTSDMSPIELLKALNVKWILEQTYHLFYLKIIFNGQHIVFIDYEIHHETVVQIKKFKIRVL